METTERLTQHNHRPDELSLVGKTAAWDSPDGPMEAKVHHANLPDGDGWYRLCLVVQNDDDITNASFNDWIEDTGRCIAAVRSVTYCDVMVSVSPERMVIFTACYPAPVEWKHGHNRLVEFRSKHPVITICRDHVRQTALNAAQEITDSTDIVTQNSAEEVESIADIIYKHVKGMSQ